MLEVSIIRVKRRIRVQEYSSRNRAVENDKTRNVTNYSIDKAHCCYFDEENLPVIDGEDLTTTTGL